LHPILHTIYN